jgi:uncharacterized protein (DUF1778 family)
LFCTYIFRTFIENYNLMLSTEKARFDTRLPLEQKQLFERAASLGGFRNLTDFMILAAQEKAKEIIKANEAILESERDKNIFFEAIFATSTKPNSTLLSALDEYNHELKK